jgi:signal transduction histidine kinase
LSDKLERHARQTVAGQPVKLNLEISPVAIETSPEEEYQLLRIAQEAMTNAVRHGHPKTLTVRLEQRRRRELEVVIRDDGRGFSTDVEHAQFGRYGLVGMRERAEEIGAKLSIHSARDFGTEVVILLRVSKEAAESAAESSTSVDRSPLGVTHE